MKRILKAGLLLAVLIPVTAPRSPLAAQTSLTIYNDGRVLVRRAVAAQVARGVSSLHLALGDLELSTLFSLDSSLSIVGATYDGATDQGSVLRRAIGRRLIFRYGGPRDTVSALVLGVDPERYGMPDGTVSFSMPGTPQFPQDLVVVDPVVDLSLKSTRASTSLRLGYFTSGATWEASYQVILGKSGSAQVIGAAIIRTDRLRVEDAEVQLLAGSVSKVAEGRVNGLAIAAAARESVAEEKVGEFHLYTLPGRLTLKPGITTSVALFEPATAAYERRYVVAGAIPYYGILQQYGEEQSLPVETSYTVKRPRRTEFGDRPLPGGTARLFQADSAGRLQLVGESSLDHTPAGSDVTIPAGAAFDLTAKRIQTTYSTRRDSLRTWATADYSVTLTNASSAAVTIDVLEQRAGEWQVLSSSVPAEKVSSTTTRFKVAVPAEGEAVLTYRVRVKW